MSQLLSNKLTFKVTDANNEESEFSVPNINPAITDTTVLRSAAGEIISLSEATLQKVILTQDIDITQDT